MKNPWPEGEGVDIFQVKKDQETVPMQISPQTHSIELSHHFHMVFVPELYTFFWDEPKIFINKNKKQQQAKSQEISSAKNQLHIQLLQKLGFFSWRL